MTSTRNKKAVTTKATAKALARGTKRDARENVDWARMSGRLLGLAVGGAQVGPIDIGAQVFAADGAVGCLLNRWAALCGNWSLLFYPLIHGRRSNADQSGQSRLTTDDFTGCLNGKVFHKAQHKAQPYVVSIGIA